MRATDTQRYYLLHKLKLIYQRPGAQRLQKDVLVLLLENPETIKNQCDWVQSTRPAGLMGACNGILDGLLMFKCANWLLKVQISVISGIGANVEHLVQDGGCLLE